MNTKFIDKTEFSAQGEVINYNGNFQAEGKAVKDFNVSFNAARGSLNGNATKVDNGTYVWNFNNVKDLSLIDTVKAEVEALYHECEERIA